MTKEEREELITAIAAAVRTRNTDKQLSDEEVNWVKNAIRLQEQSFKLRQAIIEKSFVGLVWAAVLGIGYILKEWLNIHGFKL